MQAAGDSLKEFLIRSPGRREDLLFVAAKASDQAVAGDERAERARIDVGSRDVDGAPDLARCVASRLRPISGRHSRQLPVEEDEALRQVVIKILAFGIEAREVMKPHTRLSPMRFRPLVGGIVGRQLEVDFIIFCRNEMFDDETIGERVFESQ